MNWQNYKICEIGKLVTGKTPKTSVKEFYGGNIPFLTPSDDLDSKYSFKTKKYLTNEGMESVKSTLIPQNSICVSCIGSDLGKVTITTKPTVTNQQINSIIVNTDKFDIDFVYYCLKIVGKKINYISKTSTAVPIINKTQFGQETIKCPSLKLQKVIGKILSNIDNKILLNTQINKNLYI